MQMLLAAMLIDTALKDAEKTLYGVSMDGYITFANILFCGI